MAIPGYRAKSWEPTEVVTMEGLNQMTTNIQRIHDYTPRALYGLKDSSGGRDAGVKIASGKVRIEASKKDTAGKNVRFGGFFNPCYPNISTSLNTRVEYTFLTITGLNGRLEPDQNGFRAHLQKVDNKKIQRGSMVHWVAVGI